MKLTTSSDARGEGGAFVRDQTKAHNERDAEESQVEFANGAERNQSHQNSTGNDTCLFVR